jgi:ubiquinone/menaquinone biosynthesis C-methylase UbiE
MSSTETSPSYDSRFQNPKTSRAYADRFERPTHRHINRREQRAVQKILSQLDNTQIKTLLDMPSGAGRFLPTLLHPSRTIIEIDVSHEMLQLSHQRLGGTGTPGGSDIPGGSGTPARHPSTVHFIQSDAFHLPLADNSIDCLFCNRLLHHFRDAKDRLNLLKEMHRITRRHVIISFFDYHRFGPLRLLLKRLRGRRPDYSGHPTKPAFESELSQSGFKVTLLQPTGGPWVAQVYYLLEKLPL